MTNDKLKVVSTIWQEGVSHQVVCSGNSWAYVIWDPDKGQMRAPCYGGSGMWYASGCQEEAYNYVASWVSRSTAYRRRREALDPWGDKKYEG